MKNEIRLKIIGATGRLGRSIAALALKTPGFSLASDETFDLYIDATLPPALASNLQAAISSNRPIVIGCTGLNDEHRCLLNEAAHLIPVFYSANFSLGVALLHKLAKLVAQSFPSENIRLIETHHTQKKDIPSGTALSLSSAIASSHPQQIRPSIESIREGEVIGEHELIFSLPEEQITLRHTAHSRDAFAAGALRAARFIIQQKPRLYGMEDLL